MDHNILEMFIKYPLISIENKKDCKIYKGCIRIHDKDLKIKIKESNQRRKQRYEIEELDHPIEQIKLSTTEIHADNIVTFLDCLCALLNSRVEKVENFTHIYRRVLHEYNEFTNFFLTLRNCELCSDLRLVKVSMVDDKIRTHYSEITIDYGEQNNLFHFSMYDLPYTFSPNSSLIELYNEYVSTVEMLQQYFNLMDVLDQSSHILDPVNPKRADTNRRIWLDQNLSVIITVNPLKLYYRPDIKFLGPDRLVDEYQTKLNDNLEKWEDQGDVFANILNILGITKFPRRDVRGESSQHVLRDSGDCAICFSPRLSEKLPDVICPNKSCETFYHTACLYEWLISINGRRIFNEIHGQCPNCEKDIACGIPFFTLD